MRDKVAFPFDVAMIDWKYYLKDVHTPAVTQSLRELSKRDREKPAVKIRERERAGAGGLRHGGHDHHVQRGGVLRVDPDGRPGARRVARRALRRLLEDPGLPPDRPARSRRLPADVLPAVRGRQRGGHRPAGARARGRVHAAEGERRRHPADPRAPRGRAPHRADHGGRRAVRAAARSPVRRRDRRRAGGTRRALHRVHVAAAARRRGARRLAEALRARSRGST